MLGGGMSDWKNILNILKAEVVTNDQSMTPEQVHALNNAVTSFAGTFHAMTIDASEADRVRGFVFFVENEGGKFRVQIQQV